MCFEITSVIFWHDTRLGFISLSPGPDKNIPNLEGIVTWGGRNILSQKMSEFYVASFNRVIAVICPIY